MQTPVTAAVGGLRWAWWWGGLTCELSKAAASAWSCLLSLSTSARPVLTACKLPMSMS